MLECESSCLSVVHHHQFAYFKPFQAPSLALQLRRRQLAVNGVKVSESEREAGPTTAAAAAVDALH